ncbi:SDR family oxidoreductase [Mesorhizobium sp. DCY119]|nr:SDR family oxidoreductase [Mesorhizobium sp. DCY119]
MTVLRSVSATPVAEPRSSDVRISRPVLAPRRVLVTGGAGFLGSHLCDKLLSQGHEVLCVDNFLTGRFSNIDHLRNNRNFKVLRHDVAQPLAAEVDEIYNLACPASPPDYQADPIQTMKTSVLGALNLLELAKERGIRIFQASTSEVYGDPHVHPQPESYWGNVNSFGPRSCYDEGKRCAETLFFDFHKQHGVDIRIARIFNTYGPRMRPDDGRVVSNFIVQALQGEDITIYGEGSQTRSFCYADDLIDGFLRLMTSPNAPAAPVNLGNPGEFTIRELAEQVVDLTGSRSKIVYRPLPVDDPRQRRPDISLATSALGWSPKVALSAGLQKTILYFDDLLARESRKLAETA